MKYSLALVAFLTMMVATPTALYMLSVSEQKKSSIRAASTPQLTITKGLHEFANTFYPDLPKGFRFSTSVGTSVSEKVDKQGKQRGQADLTVELTAEFWSDSEVRVPVLDRIQIRAFLPNSILTGDCERVVNCKHTFLIPPEVSVVCLDAEIEIDNSIYQSSKTCDSSTQLIPPKSAL